MARDIFGNDPIERIELLQGRQYFLQGEELRQLRRIADQGQSAAGTMSSATYEMAQSVKNLSDGLAGISQGVSSTTDAIYDLQFDMQRGFAGLGALFDWHMGTVISMLEQQQVTAYEIRDLLKYPRRTQANEDKEDARKAMQVAFNSQGDAQRQWMDRALGYFKSAAEKNPFDYTAHLDLGNLLLQSLDQPSVALECLQEAVRTAQTAGDKEYQSKAHFYSARCYEVLGKLDDAYKEANRALSSFPEEFESAASTDPKEFCVVITNVGENKPQVAKALREVLFEVCSLGLKEAKDLVEGAPRPVWKAVSKEEALGIKKALETAGATVEISSGSISQRAIAPNADSISDGVIVYECARYSVLTGRLDEMKRHAERLLRVREVGGVARLPEAKAWWAKMQGEPDFAKGHDSLTQLLEKLRTEGKAKLQKVTK